MALVEDQKFHDELDESRESNTNVVKFYNEWAGRYDEIIEQHNSHINVVAAEQLSKFYENKELIKVVDVGCGSGITGKGLQDNGFQFIDGYDISEEMVKVAKGKNIYSHLALGCITDTETLSCEDESYDALICVQSITKGHIDLENALKEFLRVLKQGGVMVYTINAMYFPVCDVMNIHNTFFKDNILGLIRLEKRFYYQVRGENQECYLCTMRKL